MAGDPVDEFLAGVVSESRPVVERIVAAVRARTPLAAAVKWGQLTFAVGNDFDHWICGVAASKRRVNLTFHFGNLLDAPVGLFEPSDAKFVRKISFESAGSVDEEVVGDLVDQAVTALPMFKQFWGEYRKKR
jgi:hypothetical protein